MRTMPNQRRLPALDLYLVLDPVLAERSGGLVKTALEAVAGGASVVQLRAPGMKKRAFVEAARALVLALAPSGVPLIIDDHADVMLASGAQGLHIGQEDLSVADARRQIGPEAILGLSAGSVEELASAPAELVDYYGVGPVFATRSKADAGEAIGLEGLSRVLDAAARPCVAIGGIDAGVAAGVARTGAAGVAVISAVCGRPDVRGAASALLAAFRSGRR